MSSNTKRRLTSPELPPAKRLKPAASFHSLYDELILAIFSAVAWQDLCRAQAVNKVWSRLATDNQLWKKMFIRDFSRGRVRPRFNFGNEVEIPNWKFFFKISTNWRTGRTESIERPLLLPAHNLFAHILIAGPLIITAGNTSAQLAPICLRNADTEHMLLCGSTRPHTAVSITAMALDQCPTSTNLAVFLSSGEFVIYTINITQPPSVVKKLTYVPIARNPRTSPITQSTYHHPLLITLSKEFQLSIYDLSGDTVSHTQTLSSFSSYPPSSLVLSCSSLRTYKLILTYAVPVYPKHYGIAVTELVISSSSTVTSTRSVRAFDVPSGWIDENKLESMREQWDRKVTAVAATQTDGKWVVLCPDDSHSGPILQLYRLVLPNTNTPRLTFVRSLHGLTGPLASLALAHGRCVALSKNGSIWVWDLEAGTCAEVSGPSTTTSVASVAFDDRRIVSCDAGGVVVRRFDV